MGGMNRWTGKPLDGWEHLVQSIGVLFTTPKLSRWYLRNYGSEATNLIDKPMNESTLIDFTILLGEAIDEWEPRYTLRQVVYETAGPDGRALIRVDGIYYPNGHLGDFETGVERGIELPFPDREYFLATSNVAETP